MKRQICLISILILNFINNLNALTCTKQFWGQESYPQCDAECEIESQQRYRGGPAETFGGSCLPDRSTETRSGGRTVFGAHLCTIKIPSGKRIIIPNGFTCN